MDDTISRAAAIDAMLKLQTEDIEAYGASIPEGFDGDRAVTALKALPSATDTNVGGNLIDRQAAISEIMEDLEDRSLHDDPATPEDYAEGYDEGIRNAAAIVLQMPSAQPGWIPWDSGGFPEESGTYTVTAYDGATKRVTYAKYQKRLKRWELTGARAYWRVLAWMEKPKPWGGGQDERFD